jgi:hypothetical protein
MADKPKLVARFILDEQGRPQVIKGSDHKHYWIELYVEDAPEGTYAVNYQLHDSYYDPVRESRNPGDRFAERLTSYGDYTVQASVRTKNRVEPVSAELSEALTRGHKDESSAMIAEALEDIKKY